MFKVSEDKRNGLIQFYKLKAEREYCMKQDLVVTSLRRDRKLHFRGLMRWDQREALRKKKKGRNWNNY